MKAGFHYSFNNEVFLKRQTELSLDIYVYNYFIADKSVLSILLRLTRCFGCD